MNCSRCGAKLEIGHKFCRNCGTSRTQLPAEFEACKRTFLELRQRYLQGEVEEAELLPQLQDLVVEDEFGNYWMLGVESGEWHRYDGQQWVRDDPVIRKKEDPGEVIKSAPTNVPSKTEKSDRKKQKKYIIIAGGALITVCILGFAIVVLAITLYEVGLVNLPLVNVTQESVSVIDPTFSKTEEIPPPTMVPETKEIQPTATIPEEKVISWKTVTSPSLGVTFWIPEDWDHIQNENNSIIAGSILKKVVFGIDWYKYNNAVDSENELRRWNTVHSDWIWSEISTDLTAFGLTASNLGKESGTHPIYEAVVGPTQNGYYIRWSLNGPEEIILESIPILKEMMQKASYTE